MPYNKGRAFIEYSCQEEASRAVAANNCSFKNRVIQISLGINNGKVWVMVVTTSLANSENKFNYNKGRYRVRGN
jgi:hypothetical protein